MQEFVERTELQMHWERLKELIRRCREVRFVEHSGVERTVVVCVSRKDGRM